MLVQASGQTIELAGFCSTLIALVSRGRWEKHFSSKEDDDRKKTKKKKKKEGGHGHGPEIWNT